MRIYICKSCILRWQHPAGWINTHICCQNESACLHYIPCMEHARQDLSETAAYHKLRRLCLRGKNGKLKVPKSVHDAYVTGGDARDELMEELKNCGWNRTPSAFHYLVELYEFGFGCVTLRKKLLTQRI